MPRPGRCFSQRNFALSERVLARPLRRVVVISPAPMFSCTGPANALLRRPTHTHTRMRRLATKVFDGTIKAHHRERAALAPDVGNYSYLHEEVARRLLDRLDDIHESYEFSDAVDLSCGPGHVRRLLPNPGPNPGPDPGPDLDPNHGPDPDPARAVGYAPCYTSAACALRRA